MVKHRTGFSRLGDILAAPSLSPTSPSATVSAPPAPPACPDCAGLGWVRRDVDWLHPEFGRPVPCRCTLADWEATRQERFARYARLPAGATAQTFERFNVTLNPTAYNAAKDWACGGALTPWLYLSGNSGTGKSHLAYAAAWTLIRLGQLVVYQNIPDMLAEFRAVLGRSRAFERNGTGDAPPSFDDVFRFIQSAPWLILDDLGAESDTAWVDEQLYLLIDGRYREGKPLLVTSNLLPEQLPRRIGSRLTDAGLCVEVDTGDQDQRPRAVRS